VLRRLAPDFSDIEIIEGTSWLDLSSHNLSVEDATELALDSGQATLEVIGSKRSYALK